MTHGKIENHCATVDGIDNPAFSGINIANARLLKNSENKNAIIGQNSTIVGTDMLEHSNNDFCTIGINSMINYSRIGNHSKNSYVHMAENAIITASIIGNYCLNEKSEFAKNATINDRLNDFKTITNTYSRESDKKWCEEILQYK